MPELKYHLLPRTRGFIASLPSMKGKVPAIYNCELIFKEDGQTRPTMTNLLFGRPVTAHMYFKRIPLEDLPTESAAQEKFLRDMFVTKDKLAESFHKTGDFFEISGVPAEESFVVDKRPWTIFNFIFWVIIILFPMAYYLLGLLFSGELLYFSIGAGIISICEYYLLKRLTSTLHLNI